VVAGAGAGAGEGAGADADGVVAIGRVKASERKQWRRANMGWAGLSRIE
jgi:hypothetical protein